MPRKSKYSKNQQAAYHSGRGYAVANTGRVIDYKSEEMCKSFLAGYRAGVESMKKSPKKYPNKKGFKSKWKK